MLRLILAAALALLAPSARAETDHRAVATRILEAVILPGSDAFADAAARLADAAAAECAEVDAAVLRERFHLAWDAWMAIQHFRFGPLQEGDRAFAIAFWPDERGATGRTVARVLKAQDPAVDDPAAFAELPVSTRGFFALERLLWDDTGSAAPIDDYQCRYVAAGAADLSRLGAEIAARWRDPWAETVTTAGEPGNVTFLAASEVTQRLLAVMLAALAETRKDRIATPLGSFDRPRPRLAEAWRSGRSLRQIRLLLEAVEATVRRGFMPELSPARAEALDAAFRDVFARLATAEEAAPLSEAVAGQGRIRVEALGQAVARLEVAVRDGLGPDLGITQGFNAADGD
ncbi:imelysin family protein [Limibaculum sp. M0105]|uniref:Imelysin family protein n=1 Tax=Thermohalobaculum xanthum TaxID=2753746 RepID=A0A8J7M676_9RHOB|nr:imelysin family protein [Thermohalobaculum xanthum]MBK0398244.1 imelysin family protein [Thermohalobaculum xanthum]